MTDTSAALRLEAFLNCRSATPARVLSLDVVTGGYSRTTSRAVVELHGQHRGIILRSDPPHGTSIIDTDRAEEWALLNAIADAGTVRIPKPLWFDEPGAELGSSTIIMELIDGPSLYTLALQRGPEHYAAVAAQLCELAATIHQFDTTRLPDHIARPASWEEYIDGRIQLWIDAEARLPMRDPFMHYVAAWLRANPPQPVPLTLVHGDLNPNNAVVDAHGRAHMIDWELAHIGDPREDIGWLALLGINQPPDLLAGGAGDFDRLYCQLTGMPAAALDSRTVDYFTVLGSTSVFLPVIERLGQYGATGVGNVNIAYTSTAVPAMHGVFLDAMNRHDRTRPGGTR